jgi:hypothetical protein
MIQMHPYVASQLASENDRPDETAGLVPTSARWTSSRLPGRRRWPRPKGPPRSRRHSPRRTPSRPAKHPGGAATTGDAWAMFGWPRRSARTSTKAGKVNIVIRGASILTGGTALVFAAAACGGAPNTTSSTFAPPGASSSATQSPASGHSVPFQFTDAAGPDAAGAASYKYRITLGNVTKQTSITPTGNAPYDAPPGQVVLVATVTLTNSTSQQEPGVESSQLWGIPNLVFAIPQSAAGFDGMKLITFTQASWQKWNGVSFQPPPKGQQCYVSTPAPTYAGTPGTLEKCPFTGPAGAGSATRRGAPGCLRF